FVEWWCDRVRTGCTNDHPEGMYGDQKWLELAPSICDGVRVLRHPGYNFAYWNAHERPLSCVGGAWTAAGWPLRFVHYSQWHAPAVDGDASEVFARGVSVLNTPSRTRADLPDLPITILYDEIWQHHADLRHRFAVDQANGRVAYLQWLVESGATELGLPAAFL